jgi:hypothetical protein
MRTIRRLYLYGVSFVSLMVVVWGLIGLARSAFARDSVGGDVTRLAGALALLFVGVPVFLLHWWLAQRSARDNEEEKYARIRAIFLYGSLLATLIPIVQNGLAILNRVFFRLFDANINRVIFGGGQTWNDNLIAMLMNGLIAVYIFSVLRQNWDEEAISEAFRETRRVYRWVWVLYGLLLTAFGIQQILIYLFDLMAGALSTSLTILANGLTLAIVGTPIWVYGWRLAQKATADQDEQQSFFRLVVLYILRLVALIVTVFALGSILNEILNALFGGTSSLTLFFDATRDAFSVVIPAGVIWGYYSSFLRKENQAFPDLPYRVEMQRLYAYVAAFLGLFAVIMGFNTLIFALIEALRLGDSSLKDEFLWARNLRQGSALGLAIIIIGLPLWLMNWLPLDRKAAGKNETGDQARRSLIRKAYVYLILFLGVIGVMISAGMLIFQVLQAILGAPDHYFVETSLELLTSLILFGLLLGYHGQVLRRDNRLASETMAAQQAEFPVLVLVPELGAFSEAVVAALLKEAPDLPVAVHVVDQGVPDETLSAAKAVILPASLTAYPQEAIRLWVQNFSGMRFVIPTPVRDWIWVSGNGSSLPSLIRHTAEMIRKLAEGEKISKSPSSLWMIVGYIFGGFIGLIGLLILTTSLIDFLFQ